jgi:hypothetical protein
LSASFDERPIAEIKVPKIPGALRTVENAAGMRP